MFDRGGLRPRPSLGVLCSAWLVAAGAGLPVAAAEFDFPPPSRESCAQKEQLVEQGKLRHQQRIAELNPLLAWVTRKPRQLQVAYAKAEGQFSEGCGRALLEGCSALMPRKPDASWESQEVLQGMPQGMRRKASPCVDTWFRLWDRKDGSVTFDVIKTDRRIGLVPDPRWADRLSIHCASQQATGNLPLQRGSLAWIGAQIFC